MYTDAGIRINVDSGRLT